MDFGRAAAWGAIWAVAGLLAGCSTGEELSSSGAESSTVAPSTTPVTSGDTTTGPPQSTSTGAEAESSTSSATAGMTSGGSLTTGTTGLITAGETELPPMCGDGDVEGDEECDDGNDGQGVRNSYWRSNSIFYVS